MALLLITHDLGIVRRIANRVCVMTAGEIVEEGQTEQVFTEPRHDYTRRLLAAEPKGDPAMTAPGVLGIDPSLTATGLARPLGGTFTVKTKAADGDRKSTRLNSSH